VAIYFVFVGAYIAEYEPDNPDAQKYTVMADTPAGGLNTTSPVAPVQRQPSTAWLIGPLIDVLYGIYDAIVAGWQYLVSAFSYVAALFGFMGRILSFDVPGIPESMVRVMNVVRPIISVSVTIPIVLILYTLIRDIINLIKPFGGG